MPLSPTRESAIRAEAKRRGVDPDEAVRRASERKAPADAPAAAPSASRPVFANLLLGALPFLLVREFRSKWLGLTERIADDDLTCGEFQAKHSGGAGSPAPIDSPPGA